ncbi:MAG: hypothetical protein HY553_11835 [Elusimicrobia bacterium]|nr:hypothetical protein [Elusimicrobiota bacterium]
MIVAAVLWLAAFLHPASAQVGVGAGIGPEAFVQGERTVREQMPILPLALAASLAFDATTWTTVGVSTVPAKDLSALLKRGYYKLELLQAVLVASRAKASLKEVTAAHDKGQSLREVAQAKGLDFDSVYGEALAIDKRVIDELLPSIMTVAVTPPKPRPEKKR